MKIKTIIILLTIVFITFLIYIFNKDEKIYPASITKLMTAILVVENCNLNDIVTVSENAVKSVPLGYVNANLQVGEQLTVEQLLYAMLIPSANDAANALAEHVGGSIESFSAMMNTRAMRRLPRRKTLIYFSKMKAIACYLSQFGIYLFQIKKGDACNENDQYQIRGFYL